MAGLVPAIHLACLGIAFRRLIRLPDMDARDKPGYDVWEVAMTAA